MLYVITDRGVITGTKLSEINSKMDAKFEVDEFKAYGPDFICKVDDLDIDFVQDKKRMSNILFANFFKKDKSIKLLLVASLVFCVINTILCSQFMSLLQKFLSAVKVG